MGALQPRHASFFLANFMMPPAALLGVVTAMDRVCAPGSPCTEASWLDGRGCADCFSVPVRPLCAYQPLARSLRMQGASGR